MSKNSPDALLVASVDPRTNLAASLDEHIMQLEARNRSLAAQRKQLDLETQANDDALQVAHDAIRALDDKITQAQELALTETK